MDPGEVFIQMRIKCGRISANGPHAAKYRIADLNETSEPALTVLSIFFKTTGNLSAGQRGYHFLLAGRRRSSIGTFVTGCSCSC